VKTQKAKLNRGSVAPKRTTRIALRATRRRPSPAYLASVENGIPNVNNAKKRYLHLLLNGKGPRVLSLTVGEPRTMKGWEPML